ncbi:catalase [Staphylococcus xylosus]|nr:catalase [Staphylococcus xylosus]
MRILDNNQGASTHYYPNSNGAFPITNLNKNDAEQFISYIETKRT